MVGGSYLRSIQSHKKAVKRILTKDPKKKQYGKAKFISAPTSYNLGEWLKMCSLVPEVSFYYR